MGNILIGKMESLKNNMKEDKLYAKDYKCVDCGKQAEVFFPICDPDIPSYPYCRECVDKRKKELMLKLISN